MSLIDRPALLKRVYEHPQERERMTDGEWCRKCIYEAPEVEAKPARRGRWLNTDETVWDAKDIDGKQQLVISIVSARCSVCNHWAEQVNNFPPYMKYEFCPHCGARMDATDTNVGGRGGEQEWTPDATS